MQKIVIFAGILLICFGTVNSAETIAQVVEEDIPDKVAIINDPTQIQLELKDGNTESDTIMEKTLAKRATNLNQQKEEGDETMNSEVGLKMIKQIILAEGAQPILADTKDLEVAETMFAQTSVLPQGAEMPKSSVKQQKSGKKG